MSVSVPVLVLSGSEQGHNEPCQPAFSGTYEGDGSLQSLIQEEFCSAVAPYIP